LYIVVLVLAAASVLGGVCGGLGRCSPRPKNHNAADFGQESNGDDDDTNVPDLFRGPPQPFTSTFELQTAVQLYAEYNTFHNVVRKYGRSMSEWDVSAIRDFSYLFDSRRLGGGADHDQLLVDEDLGNWSMGQATTIEGMFLGQRRFRGRGLAQWDTSRVVSLRSTFADCTLFDGDVSTWNTANVRDMSFTFAFAGAFMGDLSRWNTSSVRTMEYAFYGATYFNANLSGWEVQNVQNFSSMFHSCETFHNDDLTGWNTSAALDMSDMFAQAKRFDGNISTWDVRRVQTLSGVLDGAEQFGGDLSAWQPESCTDLSYAFRGAQKFNANLGSWNVRKVATLEGTFQNAKAYQGDGLVWWKTSSVRTLLSTFDMSGIGNVDLSTWDTRHVRDFSFCFYGTRVNANLSMWDTSLGTSFRSMVRFVVLTGNTDDTASHAHSIFHPLQFNEADQFDSPLYWNVSAALDLSEMFEEATRFVGQGLQAWDVSNVQTTYGMVRNEQMREQSFLLHIVLIFRCFSSR
jgi:surface protein